MINLKPKILQALESNQALVSLLGGKRIYQLVAPKPDEFPRVVFYEIDNKDGKFADDEAISSDIKIQVSVFSKGSTSAIAQEVDRTMKSLGFSRYASTDLYEEDTKVFHKPMRYKTSVMIEEE
ncbi:DUF3168 domain-containing protein [Aneurinibacillus thermoaerophilus]|uniref:tail completion protein gp17 n=1 Tax=Aneurinibacillus thermoaerophilus TaxID=143495 RepID=UPI002E201C98|nr:DUF3168 domain-containing protein [Aneurinibacillus thermoaerophilus]